MTDEHRTDGFALKRNVRQKIEIDTDIAIIGKTETETDIDFEKKSKNKIETDIDLKNRHRPSSSVRMCVCHEVSQTRCSPALGRTAFVFGSFERLFPLVEGCVNVVWCHMILAYLFSAEVTPPTKIAFFRYV